MVLDRFVAFFCFCIFAAAFYVHIVPENDEKNRIFKAFYVLCFCVVSAFVFTRPFCDDVNAELQSCTLVSEQSEPTKEKEEVKGAYDLKPVPYVGF